MPRNIGAGRKSLSRVSGVLTSLAALAVSLVLWVQCSPDPVVGARGLEAIRVPPGFEVEVAVSSELVAYPMLGTLDDRGRLFFAESSGNTMKTPEMAANPDYIVRLVEDTDGDGFYDRSNVFADKLTSPNGAVWLGGSLYVATPPDLLRFEDTDDDGVADVKEVVLTGWNLSANAASMHGPFLGPDGWLYITDGRHGFKIRTKEGELLEGKAARIWRCRPDGTGLEWVSGGGMDNPVEIAFTEAGETFGTMTYFQNPRNGQRDAILHYVEGGVYPKPNAVVEEFTRTGELMPVMTKFARIAPAGLMRYRGATFGAEYVDNLFSAQFNPHRVQRHVVTRDGATFRTEDEDFLTSSDPDFHPTDVMQDADGSLLVVDTGGWFIHGCPVSRVAKPEIRGAVYRVRKKGARAIQDPRGQHFSLKSLPPSDLAVLLSDPRPAVRDRALNLLVQSGDRAIDALKRVRENAASERARCAAVFGLSRIGSERARKAVREALDDSHFLVRVAAARSAGLERDHLAANRLAEMVRQDVPAVRRQAATGLGRLNDRQAVPALLEASANADDRFIEHAVIYSLIQLKDAPTVRAALRNPSARVRKAALIALDQMDGTPLRRREAVEMISHTDPELRRAALWVAANHPDWAGHVVEFLRTDFDTMSRSKEGRSAVSDALVAFCEDRATQELVSDLISEAGQPQQRLLTVLETMERCAADDFPVLWADRLREQLASRNETVLQRVIGLIRSRGLSSLDTELSKIAMNSALGDPVRTAALGVLVKHQPELGQDVLEYITGLLSPERDPDVRLSAARILSNAKLEDAWLLRLAQGPLRNADPLVLQSLLDACRNSVDPEVGGAMVDALSASDIVLGDEGGRRLEEILQGFPAGVRSQAQPLLASIREARQKRVERLQRLEVELTRGGDPTRGRQVFFGKKAACSTCHTMGTEGGDVGPDLTAVGAVRSVHDLVEAIIFPSASFVPGHEIYRVETEDDIYSGVRRRSTSEYVVLVSGPNDIHRIPRSKIKSMDPAKVSLMPEGFDESLTGRELTDLFAFLRSQTSREAALTDTGGG